MGMWNRRSRLVGAALIVVTLALGGCGDADEEVVVGDAPTLPIGPPGFAAESSQSPATTMWRPFEFVAADDLPALGDERRAYRIAPDADQIERLSEQLGVEPVTRTEAWTAYDEPVLVDLGGAWTLWTPGMSDSASATCDSSGECSDNSDETPTGTTAEQAEAVARGLLDGVGLDLPVTVTTAAAHGTWSVTFHYELDGHLVQGLADRVQVGNHSEIVGGFGYAGSIEELNAYSTVDTATAIERLNERWLGNASYGAESGYETVESTEVLVGSEPSAASTTPPDPVQMTTTTGPVEGDGSSGEVDAVPPNTGPATTTTITLPPPSTGVPPGAPPVTGSVPLPRLEPPPTMTVSLISVEWTLVPAPAWDGSGVYLVPAYVFTGDNGETHTAIAVTDDVIEGQEVEEAPSITPAPIPETTVAPTTTSGG